MANVTDPKFDRIYELCERPILAHCLRRFVRHHAREAANEVFTVAWQRLAGVPSSDKASCVTRHRHREGGGMMRRDSPGGDRPVSFLDCYGDCTWSGGG